VPTTFPKLVYLNGEFLDAERARISPFDRGFLFGDGVYEVIPVYGGRLFRLPHHLQRLEQSLAGIGLSHMKSPAEWSAIFERLVRENGAGDQSVYLQVTRGVAPRDHAFPPDTAATVFAYAQPLHYPDPAAIQAGATAVTVPDIRWLRCDIKAIALLPNVLMRQQALERGAIEAILIRDGYVTEGAASNIFVVRAGRLVTPPKGAFILPGITRDLVLELARAGGIQCDELPITVDELKSSDEVWLTSSTREIMPVTRIDGEPVADGRPGALHARAQRLYQEYKQAFRAGRVD
jgi:D-alanine transaminase